MKKLLALSTFIFVLTVSVSAQFNFGAGITLDLDDGFTGVQAKGNYAITDEYTGQASVSFYFENDNVSFFTIDLDAIYSGFQIGDLEGFSIRALGGLQIATASVDVAGVSASDTEIGINVGLHSQIPITDELDLYIEPKFVISGIDGIVIAAGVFF